MSRSAADATRFTATSPHAYANPTSINRASPSTYSASNMRRPNPNARLNPNARTPPPPIDPKKGNAPPAETPAEKVARLRQARLQEREAQTTTWDRLVVRGRVWADKAHKFTVYTLVGFSMVTVVIATFSLTDMILHNRRKRSAFYAEQHAIYAQRLMEAIENEKAGRPLDDDQTVVLNRERARVQAEMAAKERSWRKTIKAALLGGLKTDDDEGEGERAGERAAEMVAVPSEGEILQKIGVDQRAILERASPADKDKDSGLQTTDLGSGSGEEGTGNGSQILQAVAEKRRESERVTEAAGVVRGGPLDRMAEDAVQAVGGKMHAAEDKGGSGSSSWTNWWSRK